MPIDSLCNFIVTNWQTYACLAILATGFVMLATLKWRE